MVKAEALNLSISFIATFAKANSSPMIKLLVP